jgi:uncharacterized protein (DUF3820 family)
MSILKDNSPMPYGKYSGTSMANIPASYLLWLYENKKCSDNVARYVIENIDVLKSEINKQNKK